MSPARWAAVALFAAGLGVALLVGARAAGALIFSSGIGRLVAGSHSEDRAVGMALVVVGVGVLGHVFYWHRRLSGRTA